MYWWQMVSSLGGQESWHDLRVWVFQKYLENYRDGVDPVHCAKGTCNLSELVGFKLYLRWHMRCKCLQITFHLKLAVKVWGVPEKLPCVIAIANSLLMTMEDL